MDGNFIEIVFDVIRTQDIEHFRIILLRKYWRLPGNMVWIWEYRNFYRTMGTERRSDGSEIEEMNKKCLKCSVLI